MRYFILTLGLAAFLLFGTTPLTANAEEILWESFESDNYWQPVIWDNSAQLDISSSTEKASEGKQALKVVIKEEASDWKDKVVVMKEESLDLSEVNNIVMDVFTEVPNIEVAVALKTGGDWTYYESAKKSIAQGWNKDVKFDLNSSDFKSEASDWNNTAALPDKDDAGQFFILIYRPAKMVQNIVYIDNVRFEQ